MKPTATAAGTRVRCVAMNDPQAVPVGTVGTVVGCTAMSVGLLIAVEWDNDRYLALAVPPDRYEVVD